MTLFDLDYLLLCAKALDAKTDTVYLRPETARSNFGAETFNQWAAARGITVKFTEKAAAGDILFWESIT